jgi:hypothetical protein
MGECRFQDEVLDALRFLMRENQSLKESINQMALDLTALNAAVANETAVDQSVITLLTTLAGELATANDAGDTAAIASIVSTMQANAQSLSAAVAANTPAPASSIPVEGTVS